jgi:hypothetical protein
MPRPRLSHVVAHTQHTVLEKRPNVKEQTTSTTTRRDHKEIDRLEEVNDCTQYISRKRYTLEHIQHLKSRQRDRE